MNNKEILMMAEVVSNEKGISRDDVFAALEAALASAAKKRYADDVDIQVVVDREDGSFETYRCWTVVDPESDLEMIAACQMTLEDASAQQADVALGDVIREQVEPIVFGRIAAQAAKQIIYQKVREAERVQIAAEYKERIGTLVSGTVKRTGRGATILDLGGNAEAIIPKDQMIPRQNVRIGDRLRGVLTRIEDEGRGAQLIVSRNSPEALIELFKTEVPENGEGVVEILHAARDPGNRAKIAVRTLDPKVDPVGACVGMRGSRVQAVSNEFGDERVDIILWNEDAAQFVINAMSPTEVVCVDVEEEIHRMTLTVPDDQLALAIGKGGQNVRLASELTSWRLDIQSESEAENKEQEALQELVAMFQQELSLEDDMAVLLVEAGFVSLEDVADFPEEELTSLEGLDEGTMRSLKASSQERLAAQALSRAESEAEHGEESTPDKDLASLEGMDPEFAWALAEQGVQSRDELAELSADELVQLIPLDEAAASALIMKAREHWF